jgi:branched-chain amino acid transport system ATP-binding protein
MLLSINNLLAYYESPDRLALEEVSLAVGAREIVALLGPNGAGKSTVLKAIYREVHLREGKIFYQGTDITGVPAARLAALGIGFIPEGRRLFGAMTVEENLDLGGFVLRDPQRVKANKDKVFHLFPDLADKQRQQANSLSGGQQQMLALARALMLEPQLLLMDEPSLGLAPAVVDRIFGLITTVADQGIAILLVEQNVRKALEVAHRAYILHLGRVAFSGTPQEFITNETLKNLYMGG